MYTKTKRISQLPCQLLNKVIVIPFILFSLSLFYLQRQLWPVERITSVALSNSVKLNIVACFWLIETQKSTVGHVLCSKSLLRTKNSNIKILNRLSFRVKKEELHACLASFQNHSCFTTYNP